MSHRNRTSIRVSAAVLSAACAGAIFVGGMAKADTFVWNGNNGNFSDPAQWAGGAAPTGLNPYDTFTFGGGSYTATNDIGTSSRLPAFYFGGLQVTGSGPVTIQDGGAGNPGTFPVQVGLRSVTAAGSSMTFSSPGGATLAAPVSVGAGSTLTVNVGAGAGQVYMANYSTPATLQANYFYGDGDVVFHNQSSSPVMVGNLGGLAGNVTVTAGVVQVLDSINTALPGGASGTGGGDAMRGSTMLTVAAGATFDFNHNAEGIGGIAGSGTVIQNGTSVGLGYTSDLTWDGNISGSLTTFSKGVGSGATTYTFRGNNDYVGKTAVTVGTLVLSGGGQLSNTTNVNISPGAALVLDDTDQNLGNRINPSSTLTLNGKLSLVGAPGQATSQSLGSVATNSTVGSNGEINLVNGAGGGTATLTIDGLTRNRGGYVNFTGDGSVFINFPDPLIGGIIGGHAVVNGTDFATLDGSNKVVAYSAYQTSPNTADWQASDNVKVMGPVSGDAAANGGGGTINSLYLASADHVTVGSNLNLSSGGILATATTAIDGAGSLTSTITNAEFIFTVTGGNTLTVNTVLKTGSGILKEGDGTVELTATNTTNADIRVLGGTLAVARDANLGTGGNIRISGGTLKITADGFTTGKAFHFDGGAPATIDTNGHDATFTGMFGTSRNSDGTRNQDGGNLIKTGAGTLILANSGTSFSGQFNGTGNLTIQQGAVRTGQGDVFDTSTVVDIAAGALLDLSYDTNGEGLGIFKGAGDVYIPSGITFSDGDGGSYTFAGRIVPAIFGTPQATGGSVTKSGIGSLTLTGASTYTGDTAVTAGTLVLGASVVASQPGPFGIASAPILVGSTGSDVNNASLLLGGAGITLGRPVTVQANATGTGVATIGSANTSGTSTFAGAVELDRAAELSAAAGGTVVLSDVVSGSGGLTKVGAGTAVLAGANTFSGGLNVVEGTVRVSQPGGIGTGPVAVVGGRLEAAAGMAGPLAPSSLVISGAGTVDLNDNDMIVNYSGASPLSAVRAAVAAARDGGAWDGSGITSTSAKNVAGGTTTLAVVEASEIGAGSFDGVSLDGTAVLVKYTYYGDLNLDGKINGDDYALIDRGRALGLSGWVNGDVDSSGSVTSADYLLMDNAYGHQVGTLSPAFLAMREAEFGSAYVAALVASVPEPTSLGLLGVAAVGLLGRRRRRQD